jgi:uncharacterized protein YwgA
MQKMVYLLQAAGCPLQAEFSLHHYGPYSPDVARLSAEMVREGLLEEKAESHAVGRRYSYRLSQQAKMQLAQLEATPKDLTLVDPLAGFEERARELIKANLPDLEIASTLVFFRRQGHEWQAAAERTCRFKGAVPGSSLLRRAEALARRMIA